jgi:YHS domain-containing protein
MKKANILSLALAIIVLVAGYALAEGDAVKATPQTDCPVMGGKINKEIYADYEGKRVYFCCEGCIDVFKKDPKKYVKQLEDKGVTLDKASLADKKKHNH